MGIPLPKWVRLIRIRTLARRKAFSAWAKVLYANQEMLSDIRINPDTTRQSLRNTSLEVQSVRIALLCRQSAYMRRLCGLTTLEHLVYLPEMTRHQREMNHITNLLETLINDLEDVGRLWPEIAGELHGSV